LLIVGSIGIGHVADKVVKLTVLEGALCPKEQTVITCTSYEVPAVKPFSGSVGEEASADDHVAPLLGLYWTI
jgi:hypothetical protein